MSGKRPKLTAEKARERINKLESSIRTREQKLEQFRARIARSDEPEEKLVAATERLGRRLDIERGQLQKLKKLLGAREQAEQPQDSGEYLAVEELESIHRSFEEVRQDLSQVKMRLEDSEISRDVPNRLNSFEQRISRREEADSELFTQIMSLQTALDQERQTVRRLSRKVREQDQNIDALREAVEDSVVATVDMAERLDELDESIGEGESLSRSGEHASPSNKALELLREETNHFLRGLTARTDELQEMISVIRSKERAPQAESAETSGRSFEDVSLLQNEIRLLRSRLEALESRPNESRQLVENVGAESNPSSPKIPDRSNWEPAIFSNDSAALKLQAKFHRGSALKS